MTDGILVQKLYSDPLLDEFSVIVLDDVHERSINYEILFGFLKIILIKRKNLKVVITSATLDDKSIKAFFEKKQIHHFTSKIREITFKEINVTGRLYSVSIHYLKESTKNYFLKAFQTIIYIDR
jgi:HrpA-like RNA helicase